MVRFTVIFICGILFGTSSNAAAWQKLKVYISVDMEGIGGAVSGDQVGSSGPDYDRFRRLMTEETNAAVRGALDAGATEVVVNDSHGAKRNLLIEGLHPSADLISGSPKKHGMMEGIDESYDAVVFIGYHASMGTETAILDHTISSGKVANVRINGIVMNEGALNAALAGFYGVPVVFVAGDKDFVDEARSLIGEQLEAVAVKEAVSRQAARNLSVEKVRTMIRERVKRGIEERSSMPVFTVQTPVRLEIDFHNSGLVDKPSWVPGVERIGGRTIAYTSSDYEEIYRTMRILISLAGS
jgi:D-amino peptidase